MLILHSEIIKLVALDYQQIQLWAESWAEMEKSLNVFPIIPDVVTDYQAEIDDALQNYWLPKVAENMENYEWFTAWQIVHIEQNVIIGGIGFMGLPDENGQTMTGYHVDRRFQRQGIASHALALLSDWAFENHDLKSITATTNLDNVPSHRVLQKNNFIETKRDEEFIYWELKRPEV